MPTTSTGVAGTSIVAQCSVPSSGDFVTGAGIKTAIDPINDDLATIKAGTYDLLALARKTLIRPRLTLADADHSVNVSQGDRWNLPGTTAAVRTITLISSGPGVTPTEGETLGFFCNIAGLTTNANGAVFKFIHEDATTAAVVYGATGTMFGNDDKFWLFFEFTGGMSAGWRLAENSGWGNDGGGGGSLSAFYGVRLS